MTSAFRAAFTGPAGQQSPTGGGRRECPAVNGVAVNDVEFVLLILAVFGLLALVTKGVEKL